MPFVAVRGTSALEIQEEFETILKDSTLLMVREQ
jgi:hypothetical protein